MDTKLIGAAAAALVLGVAPLAHAGIRTVDLSPYVNQGFNNGGWFIDGFSFQANLPGVTTGNQGSSTPFRVANVSDGRGGHLNYWYGRDDGTNSDNLFGGTELSFTIPVAVDGVTTVYTLTDNTFGRYGVDEYSITFHGAGGDLVGQYVGGFNTRDYNTPNCASTGCASPTGSTPWFNDGRGIVLEEVAWALPKDFGLTSITFQQEDFVDGAIVAGVSLGAPEPATWALMIGGFALAGVAMRRRRALLA